MSLALEHSLYVSGDATEKATFESDLNTAATSAGYTGFGTNYSKSVAYDVDVQAQKILFLQMVQTTLVGRSGLSVQVTTTADAVSFSV